MEMIDELRKFVIRLCRILPVLESCENLKLSYTYEEGIWHLLIRDSEHCYIVVLEDMGQVTFKATRVDDNFSFIFHKVEVCQTSPYLLLSFTDYSGDGVGRLRFN